jgi:hypothetical protein
MKSSTVRVSVRRMRRLPHGEKLDRLVAFGLVVIGQLELWAGNPTPGLSSALAAPLEILICGLVAVRRRWPLAAGIGVVVGTDLIFALGGRNYSLAIAVAWICALHGVAVWTDTRAFLTGLVVLLAANAASLISPQQTIRNFVLFTVIPGGAMLIARRASGIVSYRRRRTRSAPSR